MERQTRPIGEDGFQDGRAAAWGQDKSTHIAAHRNDLADASWRR